MTTDDKLLRDIYLIGCGGIIIVVIVIAAIIGGLVSLFNLFF